jgi:prevent-host-death family protein
LKTVNIHDAKTHFSKLLAAVEEHSEKILICRNGQPVAELVPHRRRNRTKTHPQLSRVKINYDPVEPLSEDEWPKGAR